MKTDREFETEEPLGRGEFESRVLRGVRELHDKSNKDSEEIERLKSCVNDLSAQSLAMQRARLRGLSDRDGQRKTGRMGDQAAAAFGAHIILVCAKHGKLDILFKEEHVAQSMLSQARDLAGISQRSLTTSETPLPVVYAGDLRELIADYGVARRNMFHYPLAGGVNHPPRMGTRPLFSFIDMAEAFPEKKPTFEFAQLNSRKIGGIIICPREIEEQSIVSLGEFLARYAAIEFARMEDTVAFLADGSSTYKTVKGITKITTDNAKNVQLASTKTKPSDATIDDFRLMRQKVSTAALKNGKYYLNQTWEAKLRSFRTVNEPDIFSYRPDGTATLDGFPIEWTEVLQPYGTAGVASAYLAVFGRLDFWFFGERMSPRIDTSLDVYFASDQIATRFIEEIDFDYQSLEAASSLQTAAS